MKEKLKNYGFKREFLMKFGHKTYAKKNFFPGKAVVVVGGGESSLKGSNYGGSLLLKLF